MPTRHNDLAFNEKSLNAIVDSMSAITLCLTQLLTPDQRERFGAGLVTMAVKRARFLALLPYTAEHVRRRA